MQVRVGANDTENPCGDDQNNIGVIEKSGGGGSEGGGKLVVESK